MLLEGRKHPRSREQFVLEISGVYDPRMAELVSVEDVSSQGVRVAAKKAWEPGSHVHLKWPNRKEWGRARVVYCQPVDEKRFAVGLNLITQPSDWNEQGESPRTRK